MIEIATRIVTDYGKVLGQARPGVCGLPESLLPHSREQIRNAIRFLIKNLSAEDAEIRQSLVHGYVYLAQFIPDQDMATINAGQQAALNAESGQGAQSEQDNQQAEQAMRLINQIKLAMERALNEVSVLVQS